MVKSGKMVMKKKVVVKRKAPKQKRARTSAPTYGPVTTIDTAPIAIGNSYNGSAPIVVPVQDGMRVKGRDYLLGLDAALQLYVNDWTMVGGSPITPACMIASAVKGFNNTYAEYCIHAVAFHYITSSSTAHDGSVMMYVGKGRSSPLPDTSNANFLSFVLSDHNTTISPVWKNSTSVFVPPEVYRSTSPFDGESLEEQGPGELFVYLKYNTNTTDIPLSPGYIIIDYDITFRNMSLNIKNLTFPCSRMKYSQVALHLANPIVATPVEFDMNSALRMDGATSFPPSGWLLGDVYKVTMNTDNSSGPTNFSLWWQVNIPVAAGAVVQPVVIKDGHTCYGVINESNRLVLFPNYSASMAEVSNYRWNAVAAGTYTSIAYISLVGSAFGLPQQSNF